MLVFLPVRDTGILVCAVQYLRHNGGKRYDDNNSIAATLPSHKALSPLSFSRSLSLPPLCTCLLAPVTHYRTSTFPVLRRRPKQSRRNSVASSRSDGYRYQRKEARPARHSSADAFVSKLPDARSFETGVYGALISIFHLTDLLGQ